jgi:hypothetical protein
MTLGVISGWDPAFSPRSRCCAGTTFRSACCCAKTTGPGRLLRCDRGKTRAMLHRDLGRSPRVACLVPVLRLPHVVLLAPGRPHKKAHQRPPRQVPQHGPTDPVQGEQVAHGQAACQQHEHTNTRHRWHARCRTPHDATCTTRANNQHGTAVAERTQAVAAKPVPRTVRSVGTLLA